MSSEIAVNLPTDGKACNKSSYSELTNVAIDYWKDTKPLDDSAY